MKSDWSHLEKYRLRDGDYGTGNGATFGFFVWQKGTTQIRAMAADGQDTGWEHVSVTIAYKTKSGYKLRMPTWDEMHWIKRQFWDDEEAVVQFHPRASEYVNNHPYCLHLWKCVAQEFPEPPSILVGLKTA